MSFLAGIAAKLIEKYLTKLITWAWKYGQSRAKVNKAKKRIDIERDRLKEAIDSAYDGSPLTEEQQLEIIDASRALHSDY